MKLEIRDINYAAILDKHYHESTVIDFAGVSLAIVGSSCNYQPYGTIWGFEFAEAPKASLVNGLPQIGTHACVHDPEGLLMYGSGEEGEVIAHIENTAVVRMSYGLGCFSAKHLRTKEQIEAEERDKARTEALNAMTADGRMEGENEENWQFRMQIVGEMLDMGYRKV